MDRRCIRSCERKNNVKAESTGWRATFYYPGGGTYKGGWLRSQHQRYGVKENSAQLIYDGQWLHGQRHGHGTMRRRLSNGTAERVYVGEWRYDMKCGEGKQFYKDGVYYGWWRNNRRHGLGIMWYKDGSIYLGEWEADVHHGLGVLFCVNGNRYEGHFARGFKNGEGTFYHMHTGQIQKGMWENDVCKVSMVVDEFRSLAKQPTKYAMPKIGLAEPDRYIRQLFQKYMGNADKPTKSFEELTCLHFVHKLKRYAKFEPKAISNSKIPLDDLYFPCVCKKREKSVLLSTA